MSDDEQPAMHVKIHVETLWDGREMRNHSTR